MRAPRVTLLLAAALLVSAELVSLTLLLQATGEHQTRRADEARERAALLMPRIADWVRAHAGTPGAVVSEPWIEPFTELAIDASEDRGLDALGRSRLAAGELVVASRMADRTLRVFGSVGTDRGSVVFRLSEESVDVSRLASDRMQIAQHALILLAALAGLLLAALSRSGNAEEAGPAALRAYEEAMLRLRVRGDERLATFDREKDALIATLRDREAMARAGELTAGIVHEVRNSLGAIGTQARLLEKSPDERGRPAASAILDEVRMLQSVMTAFLDFVRTERVQDEVFDLARLVDRVTAREGSAHGVAIRVEGSEARVRGDEELLERAIENVVRNACQASGPDGSVSVSFGVDAAQAFVIVDDTGPGIANPQKALRPFESSRPGGLGLGLPFVVKILALHHGTLDLGPGPGESGTRAVCRWPISGPGATVGNDPSSAVAVAART